MTTPESVTYREVQEILRTFADSGWSGMTLEVEGMRITVGKNGPPTTGTAAPTATVAPAETTTVAPAAPAIAPAAAEPAPAKPAPAGPPPASAVDTTGCVEVRSPAVGSFWVAPSPGEPPFVAVGQTVADGEQLAIVEVMKLMNPVISGISGEVVQVCAANASLVEYEQVLFLIRPSDG
jgi:acetyl-CoA carboxylase biotin carboxyl carrier protein